MILQMAFWSCYILATFIAPLLVGMIMSQMYRQWKEQKKPKLRMLDSGVVGGKTYGR